MPAQKLHHVDALRGVAILAVILLHVAQTVTRLPHAVRQLANYGQFGVQLFFVMSAFTICRSLVLRAGEPSSTTSFLIRRLFRIAPLYLLAIPLYALMHQFRMYPNNPNLNYGLGAVLSNVFFIHAFVPAGNDSVVPGGWSIGTEIAFYVLIAFAFKGLNQKRLWNMRTAIWTFISAVLLDVVFEVFMVSATKHRISDNSFLYFSLLTQLPVFALGVVLFFWKGVGALWSWLAFLIISTIALGLCALGEGTQFAFIPTIAGLSFVFLSSALAQLRKIPNWIQAIGRVSFSMYVFHFIFAWWVLSWVVNTLPATVPPVLEFLVGYLAAAALSFSMAKVTKPIVEDYGVSLGARLISWNQTHTALKVRTAEPPVVKLTE